MSSYIHGSLALDDRQSATTPRTKPKAAVRKAARPKGVPAAEKLLYIAAVVAACAVAGIVAMRYATVYEMNSQVVQVEKEIRNLEEQNAKLKNEISKLQDPERLIDIGYQLGLVPEGEVPASAPGNGEAAVALGTAD